jgi:hypothetical protein
MHPQDATLQGSTKDIKAISISVCAASSIEKLSENAM